MSQAAVVVNGAAGRMGRLVAAALLRADLGLVAGCDPGARAPLLVEGRELPLVADLVSGVARRGVIVDFSHPAATAALYRAALEREARLVVGTTGQDEDQMAALQDAAGRVPVVLARNFALGLNRLLEALPTLRVLLREGFDVECLEAHHRQKRDAPSGTAELLLESLLGDAAVRRVHGRHGVEARREPGEVGIHSLRLGQVVGEHALFFGSDHEVIEVRHRALDRGAFASGVVPAVRFVRHAAPGLYSMRDVIGDAATADD